MIQNVLRTLGGVEGYGIVSLCIFCSIFALAIIWAMSLRREQLDAMARLPLERDHELSSDNHPRHE